MSVLARVDALHPFTWPQSRDIHIITIIPSTLSLTASILASYWFISMQRNFRITLILILILADASKSLWIFIFSCIGLADGEAIKSQSALCQAGGFFLQMSFEACDLAIFLLTMHITLQVIAPKWIPNSRDGLYPIRRWVVAISIVLPIIDALIPFTRLPADPPYTFDGAYCSLFVEPRWYSLSLSWIPRYTIWLIVLLSVLSILTYTKSQTFSSRRNSSASQVSQYSWHLKILFSRMCACWRPRQSDQASMAWRRDSRTEVDELMPLEVSRQGTRSQLRKLLLYPVIYIMAWSVPFATQIVSYTTQQDVDSVFALRAASVFCISLLGFVDVVIFCLRERPWRYHSRGNGTCTGTLCLGSPLASRRPSATSQGTDEAVTPLEPTRPLRTHNKGADSHRRSAMQAYERLAMERAEAAARPPMRRFSGLGLTLTNTLDMAETNVAAA